MATKSSLTSKESNSRQNKTSPGYHRSWREALLLPLYTYTVTETGTLHLLFGKKHRLLHHSSIPENVFFLLSHRRNSPVARGDVKNPVASSFPYHEKWSKHFSFLIPNEICSFFPSNYYDCVLEKRCLFVYPSVLSKIFLQKHPSTPHRSCMYRSVKAILSFWIKNYKNDLPKTRASINDISWNRIGVSSSHRFNWDMLFVFMGGD